MLYDKQVSAIYNDVVSGISGYVANPTISIEQLEDDYIDERMQIIKEYVLKGLVPRKDLLYSINCIEVDCMSLEKCPCDAEDLGEKTFHFEIPQLLNDFGLAAIEYMGSVDKRLQFVVYDTAIGFKNHKYRKRGKDRPYVYIDMAPNENNMLDCFVFNAPFLTKVSVTAVFKDPRQLAQYSCCPTEEIENISVISNEIKRRLTEKKIRYYRLLAQPPMPNNQVYK